MNWSVSSHLKNPKHFGVLYWLVNLCPCMKWLKGNFEQTDNGWKMSKQFVLFLKVRENLEQKRGTNNLSTFLLHMASRWSSNTLFATRAGVANRLGLENPGSNWTRATFGHYFGLLDILFTHSFWKLNKARGLRCLIFLLGRSKYVFNCGLFGLHCMFKNPNCVLNTQEARDV